MLKLKWVVPSLFAIVLLFGMMYSSSTAALLSDADLLPQTHVSEVKPMVLNVAVTARADEEAEIAAVRGRQEAFRAKVVAMMPVAVEKETAVETPEVAVASKIAVAETTTPVAQYIAEPVVSAPATPAPTPAPAPAPAPVQPAPVVAPANYKVAPGIGFAGSDMRGMSYTPWYPNWEPSRNANDYSADVQWFIDQGHIAMAGRPQDNYDGYPTMLIGHDGGGMSHIAPWIGYGSVLEVGDVNGTYRQYQVTDILANPASTAYATFANGVNNGDVFYWGVGGGEAVVISLCQGGQNYYYYAVPIN